MASKIGDIAIIFSLFFVYFFEKMGIYIFLGGLMFLWIIITITKRSIYSLLPDIVYGMIDTGSLVIFIYVGAILAGLLGAIVAAVISDAITDSVAGAFEGKIDETLRKKDIDASRTFLSSSLGKMSGCLIGGGIALLFMGF